MLVFYYQKDIKKNDFLLALLKKNPYTCTLNFVSRNNIVIFLKFR